MIKYLLLFSFSFCLTTTYALFAQTENDMKTMITKVVEQNKEGHSKENVDKMMEYFRPDALVNISRIAVTGKRYHNVLRKGEYKSLYVTQYNQNVHRESQVEIFSTKIQGNIGVCVFSLKYTLVNDGNGKVQSKGIEYITATFVARNGKWHVLELNITDIEEEQFQGKCSCEVYTNPKTGSVIAKVGAPKGDRYENEMNNLYSKTVNGETFYMVQGVIFQWFDKKEMWTVDTSYKKVEKLGPAKTKELAMKEIMMYLYKNECSEMDMVF